MSDPELIEELRNAAVEPLLPVERRLIRWSLGLGVVLLVLIAALGGV